MPCSRATAPPMGDIIRCKFWTKCARKQKQNTPKPPTAVPNGITHCKKMEITVHLIKWVPARILQNAWLLHCSWLCGGAPAAWCQAKGSSRLMWVTPAATGLWFISLGMESRTLQSLQNSQLALGAADITENIKLLCRAHGLKWKLECLLSPAFALTLFFFPVLTYSHDLIPFNPIFKTPTENDFQS